MIELIYLVEEERGISQARNRAVYHALLRGADYVAFIDDDDLPNSDWLSKLWIQRCKTDADIVFGCWALAAEAPEWLQISGIFKSSHKSTIKPRKGEECLPWMAATCNVLVKAEVFQLLDSQGHVFDPELSHSGGEDKDFFLRAQANGATITSAADSIVIRHHEPKRYSARGLLNRGFKNGCSRMKKISSGKGGGQLLSRMLYSCIKLLLVLICLPFCIFSRRLAMGQIYRMGKAGGTIYFFFSRRSYAYYNGNN